MPRECCAETVLCRGSVVPRQCCAETVLCRDSVANRALSHLDPTSTAAWSSRFVIPMLSRLRGVAGGILDGEAPRTYKTSTIVSAVREL